LHTISSASPAGTRPGPDQSPAIAWDQLLDRFTDLFRKPSSALFLTLVAGWVLWPGRRTVTRMVEVADPDGAHAHDAYHRLLREGKWDMAELWRRLAPLLVSQLGGNLRLVVDLDDTLFHKAGHKVNGAGSFRDPIRSRGQRTVFAHGLNLVVLTLRVQPPWGGEPIGLPINMRRYSKRDGRSLLDLGQEMIEEVARWLPDHSFILGCDGAYASLAGRDLPRTHLVSRIQRNAALYDPPPPRTGKRGRPRKKGARLGTPVELARAADDWTIADIDVRGEQVERALWARPLLWYSVRPLQQVMLVVVADPDQRQHDDLLFCTDLAIPPELVASLYYGRWSIEVTFRDTKQLLGGQEPQCWKAKGPERAAALSFWLYSGVWSWYLARHGVRPTWRTRPSYPTKRTPSFADALSTLRRELWSRRIFDASDPDPLMTKISALLIDVVSEAA
jgi:hypothetical protein